MDTISERRSVYDQITDRIIEAIKAGAGAYQMPWHSGQEWMSLPINVATEAYYRGVNVLSLWLDARKKGFPTSHWASYRQWQSLGAQVRGGEHGSLVVFYKPLEPDEDRADAEDLAPRFVLRSFRAFNAAQVDGWTAHPPEPLPAFELDRQTEAFVAATNARVRHGFAKACYQIDLDDIEMPSPAWFTGTTTSSAAQSYHAVLLHELVHWSGASHRIGREFGKRFGDRTYAFEELIAELGAAFLCSALGLANEPRPDHAAYVASWLEVLERDHRAIFTAAARAQEAVEYLAQLGHAAR
jgi:antirestriction protein ArdC